MRAIANFLSSLILATGLVTIAVVSIQNITPISLKFLAWSSIPVPLGVVLSFNIGVGMVCGALLPLLGKRSNRNDRPSPYSPPRFEEDDPLENWDE